MKVTQRAQSLPQTTPQKTEPADGLQEQIRVRAYELYEQRGREDGHDVEDWLQSEAEVKAT